MDKNKLVGSITYQLPLRINNDPNIKAMKKNKRFWNNTGNRILSGRIREKKRTKTATLSRDKI